MSAPVLKELVRIQGSYISAVDIADTYSKACKRPEDMEEMERKVGSYLLNDSSIDAILDIARGLSPGSNERAHLVSGAYGTGKSHLGLVLANYFAVPSQSPQLEPLFSQMAQHDPDKAAEIRLLRQSQRGFLIVTINGMGGSTFDQALLEGLRNALLRENLSHLVPTTAFELARDRITAWKRSKTDLYGRYKQALLDMGQTVEGIARGLKDYDEQAFEAFCQAHRRACDAPFEAYREDVEAKRFYADVSQVVTRETDIFKGIAVIWDEYGEYLKSTAQGGGDRLQSQFFAQFCNSREDYQCHFIVIAHLGLRDYFTTPLEYNDYVKQSGRFKESSLTTSNAEELIARAMVQLHADNSEAWKLIRKTGNWGELAQTVIDLDLYPSTSPRDVDWIKQTVIEGCFPLHPLTVYCLPRLSEKVAQRHRTTFEFLKDLAEFLDNAAYTARRRLNLYPADRLFDYFEKEIEAHKTLRRVFRAVKGGEQQVQNEQQARILRVIGVFDILKDRRLRATADVLFAALYLPETQRDTLERDLATLIASEVLRKTAYTEEYKFRGGEDYDYAEDFKQERREVLRRHTNPIQILNSQSDYRAPDVQAAGLKPDGYNSQFKMDRQLRAQFINAVAFQGLNELQAATEIDQPPHHDGALLYVVASSQEEIQQVRSKAETFRHPQIAIAISQSPSPIVEALMDLKTASALRQKEPYGKFGTDAYEEAKEQEERYKETFESVRRSLLMPDNLTCYVSGKVETVSGRMGTEDLASRMMFDVFPDTPKITQERVAYKWKRSQKQQIVEVLDAMMDFHTPIKLRAGVGKPSSKELLLQASLYGTGLLEFQRNAGINDDYEIEPPAEGSSGYKAWVAIDKLIQSKIAREKLAESVSALQRPPFGMGENAIAIFLAAYFRYKRRDLTFLHNGTVVPTLAGEAVYEMVRNPSAYTILYREINPLETRYLITVCRLVVESTEMTDQPTIVETARCLKSWLTQLPNAAKSGQGVSAQAQSLLTALTGNARAEDESLLFTIVPESLGISQCEVKEWDEATLSSFEDAFSKAVAELDGVCEIVAQKTLTRLRHMFGVVGTADPDLAEGVRLWLNNLSEECQLYPHTGHPQLLKEQAQGDAPVRERFLVKLPEGFGFGRFTAWSDPDAILERYIQKVTEAKMHLEEFSIEPSTPSPILTDWKGVLRERLKTTLHEFSSRLSRSEIVEVLANLLKELKT